MEVVTEKPKRNTVPEGYKLTEVGKIPEDWKIAQINDVADVATGSTPSTKDRSNYGNEYLFVSPVDLGDEPYITDTEKKLSEKGFSKSRKFPKNSTLFTCIGSTIGKTGIATIELTSNQQINAVFPSEKCNYLYVYYILTFKGKKISKLAGKQAVPIINKSEFQSTKLPFPPTLEEQQAIAKALSDVDALIAELDALIEKKRQVKKGAMQQLLTGKKRLPGFDGEWEEKKLGEIADIGTGSKDNQDKIDDGQYPFFVRSQNVERINTYSFEGEAILVPGEGRIGEIFHYIDGKFDYHQRVYKISNFRMGVIGKFIYFKLLHEFYSHAMEHSVKATVDSLRLPTFEKFSFTCPATLREQKIIVEILDDMDAEIQALQSKQLKYEKIKQGMMQELLTGKTRLV